MHQNDRIRGISFDKSDFLIAQFADDTEFVLDGTETSLQATLDNLSYFGEISGLRMNMDKTRAVWLGAKA